MAGTCFKVFHGVLAKERGVCTPTQPSPKSVPGDSSVSSVFLLGIAEHWCPCLQWSSTTVHSKPVEHIARSAVAMINRKLTENSKLYSSCHQLTLQSVEDALMLRANPKVQTFESTDQDGDDEVSYSEATKDLLRYQIIFTTLPNHAKYEVTAHFIPARNHAKINPEISRLNRYDNQPSCIAKLYPYARMFCLCKNNVKEN